MLPTTRLTGWDVMADAALYQLGPMPEEFGHVFMQAYGVPVLKGLDYSLMPRYCKGLKLIVNLEFIPEYLNIRAYKEWTRRQEVINELKVI